MGPFVEPALSRSRSSLAKRLRRPRNSSVCLPATVTLALTRSLAVAAGNCGSATEVVLDVDETVVDGLIHSRQGESVAGGGNSSPSRSGDLHDHELIHTSPTRTLFRDSVVLGETPPYVLYTWWRYEGLSAMSSHPCVGTYTEFWRSNWYGGHDITAASFTDSDGRVAYGGVGAGDYAVVIWVDDCRVLRICYNVVGNTFNWWTGWFSVSSSVAIP